MTEHKSLAGCLRARSRLEDAWADVRQDTHPRAPGLRSGGSYSYNSVGDRQTSVVVYRCRRSMDCAGRPVPARV